MISKKAAITLSAISITLAVGAANIQVLKSSFSSSKLGAFYVEHYRDGIAVDAEHLITTLKNGMSIIVNKLDRCVCWQIRMVGYWDSSETKALTKVVKKGFNVVEIGSNFGVHTLNMAGMVGETGKIYAFEANPNVSKYLKRSVALNKLENRVHVFAMALANKSYSGFMVYDSSNIGGGYILPNSKDTQSQCADTSCTPINVAVLDEVLPSQKIDLLKMDAEGSEFWIMQGAQSLLKNNPDITLMMEWDTRHLNRNGADISSFIQMLQDNNFHAWSIARGGKLKPIAYASLKTNASYDLIFSRDPNKFNT